MITSSNPLLEGIVGSGTFTIHFRLQSWFDGELLSESIPAENPVEEADGTLRVPERLTFRVPAEVSGESWVPVAYDHPLGCWGQRIHAQIGIGVAHGAIEWINRGQFLITSVEGADDALSVEAVGLLQLVDEAVFAAEYQPKASAQFAGTIRNIVEPGLTVYSIDPPSDRTLPTNVTYSDNRLDTLYSVLDAWPAQVRVNENGHLDLESVPEEPEMGDEVFHFTDHAGGTSTHFRTGITRQGAFNAVVAKGQFPETHATRAGMDIIYTAYDYDADSPFRRGGPFSPYTVPHGYASPLLTTSAEVYSAAQTRMRNLRERASRTVEVTAVPNPLLRLGDPVTVTNDRLKLDAAIGRLDGYRLPYTPGEMTATVRLGSAVRIDEFA